MPGQKPSKRKTSAQREYELGYRRGVLDLGLIVGEIVSSHQFHEIAERWEQLQLQRKREQERKAP